MWLLQQQKQAYGERLNGDRMSLESWRAVLTWELILEMNNKLRQANPQTVGKQINWIGYVGAQI